MKKIVSVLVVLALACSVVFADVAISGNFRMGTNLINAKEDSFIFNDMAKIDWPDTTKFAFKGEKAGIDLVIKMSATSGSDVNVVNVDSAYGWMSFGSMYKLSAGTKDTRGFMKRVNPLDGNWWNNYCEYGKPGLHKDYKVSLDSGNVTTNFEGKKQAAFLNEFTFNKNMNLGLALYKGENKGFNAAVQFNGKFDPIILNVTAKTIFKDGDDNDSISVGLFANFTGVKNLDLLLGYTLATADTFKNLSNGIDLRVSYKLDALTLYTLNNFTIADEARDNKFWSWHTIGAAYKINDTFSAAGVQALLNNKGDFAKAAFKIRPYVDITAQKNAVLSVGLELDIGTFDNVKVTTTMPVVFRIKL